MPEPVHGYADTNIIVYALTGQPPDLGLRAKRLLQQAIDGEVRLTVTSVVVAEAVYVLGGRHFALPRDRVATALMRLLRQPGVVCEEADAVLEALLLYAGGLDFADGYLCARARAASSPVYA